MGEGLAIIPKATGNVWLIASRKIFIKKVSILLL
jgi:hypothetical protein